jgi:hypothetical protein
MKKALLFVAALLCCTLAAEASTTPAPPIDTAALAAYAHGNGAVSGSVRFDGATQAVCAPDIPYVAWYVEEKKRGDASDYDSQLIPYTHHAWVAKDRTFTCQGLAPGSYLVWVEGYTRGFPESAIISRQPDDPVSGQMLPAYDANTVAIGGSGPEQSLVGPEHVVVTGTGTTNVKL